MLKIKFLTLLLYFKSLLCPCTLEKESQTAEKKPKYHTKKIGKLPEEINESSAVIVTDSSCPITFLTVNDHGGKPVLYHVFPDPKKFNYNSWAIKNANNFDWEELTSDDLGNIYIGDFGNNYNSRKQLNIYIVNAKDSMRTDSIRFSFEDQHLFPPPKEELNFDCESFFWHDQHLYLFSKNRGSGLVKVYRLPDQPGIYQAKIVATLNITGMITSADISPDKKMVVLLSYGKIYFFKFIEGMIPQFQPISCRKFPRGGQSEGICFINNYDLLVTNEGRNIFLLKHLKKKK